MTVRPALTTWLLALAGAGLSACGAGSEPTGVEAAREQDREQIESLVGEFAAAVQDQDTEAFCALLAPLDKARLVAGRNDGEARCKVLWGPRRNPLFGAADATDITLDRITKLDPPTATARLANGGRLVFSQEEGAWYISLAPEGGGRR